MKNIRIVAVFIFFFVCSSFAQTNLYFANPYGGVVGTVCGTNSIGAFINTNNVSVPPYQSLKLVSGNNILWESQSNFSTGYSGSEYPISIPGSAISIGPNVVTVIGTRGNNANKIPLNSITIDGLLNESYWNNLPNIGGFMVPCGACNTATMANAFAFNVLYDSLNVYVAIKVIDNTLSTGFGGGVNDFQNDGVEIYIDPLKCNCGYLGASPASVSQVMQLRIGFNAPDNSFNVWPSGPPVRTTTGFLSKVTTFSGGSLLQWERNSSSIKNPVVVSGTGYIVEMLMPLETFFGTYQLPTPGQNFGFDIAVNDNQFGSGRTQQLQWGNVTGADFLWNSAGVFGNFYFGNTIDTKLSSQPGGSSNYGVLTIIGIKTPAPTTNVTITGDCNSTLFLQAPATGNGTTNFWQTTSSATQTNMPASAIQNLDAGVVNASTSYYMYLNSRDNNNQCWSNSLPIEIKPKVDFNSTNLISTTFTPTCASGTISATGIANQNNILYWQTESTTTGTSRPIISTLISTSIDTTLFILSRNTITGCWSDPSSAFSKSFNVYNVFPEPPLTATNYKSVTCRGASISVTGILSPNEVYFIQTTFTGKSQSIRVVNSEALVTFIGNSFVANTLNTLSGCWSVATTQPSFVVTDIGNPNTPNSPIFNGSTQTVACRPGIITLDGSNLGNLKPFDTWYWQLDATSLGTNLVAARNITLSGQASITTSGINVSSTGTYFLRNYYQGNGDACWSTARYITVTIVGNPPAPAKPKGDTMAVCNLAILTFSGVSGNNTIYIVPSATSTIPSNINVLTGVKMPFSASGSYFLRSRTNLGNGDECWSDATPFKVTVAYTPPVAAAPILVASTCGVQTITSTNSTVLSVKNYWQTASNGTSKTNSSKNLIVTNSGTAFLLAVDTIANCPASGTSQFTYNVGPQPFTRAPIAYDTSYVQGDDAAVVPLAAFSVGGGNLNWFNDTVTGVAPLNQPVLTQTKELGAFNFWVNETNGLCVSPYKMITVTIKEGIVDLAANTGITPNEDGKNDFFYVPYIYNYPSNKVTLLDKWGNVVFAKENYDNNFKAEGVSAGSYYYIVDLGNGTKPKTGTLTIVK
ncbi:MAG: sugar-binding protein [Bacteroidota bacterium]|nr:sugar-binding protein [Bacteroidota bacterium]